MPKRKPQVDKELARKIALYIENDYQLYKQMYVPIALNYARKIVKGTFNGNMAIKGIINLVNAGIRKYNKEVARLPPVSQYTKRASASELYSGIMELVATQRIYRLASGLWVSPRDFVKKIKKTKKKPKKRTKNWTKGW